MPEQGQKSISILIQEKEPKPTIAVSGAWGGPSPQGEVIAHVYVEYGAVPSILSVDLGPDGEADLSQASRITRGDLIREIQCTLVMSPEVAVSFGTWLIEKGQQGQMNRGGAADS